MRSLSALSSFRLSLCRTLHSSGGRRLSGHHVKELDKWVDSRPQLTLRDTFHVEHLMDLYVTIPTRDGSLSSYQPPKSHLEYGHHLVFFHQRLPERMLREDGTDSMLGPPFPFKRRMWTGGVIEWNLPVPVGLSGTAYCSVKEVTKKRFDSQNPLLFVSKRYDYVMDGHEEPSIREERTHVYLPEFNESQIHRSPVVKEVSVPQKSSFELTYCPSLTTLFRFSALTFNGHRIHLDRDYAQDVERHKERLVHGPLTALMMLETLRYYHPGLSVSKFTYRTHNPLVVNTPCTIKGSRLQHNDGQIILWALDEEGVVVMTGLVEIQGT